MCDPHSWGKDGPYGALLRHIWRARDASLALGLHGITNTLTDMLEALGSEERPA